jgi:hypothetical protein
LVFFGLVFGFGWICRFRSGLPGITGTLNISIIFEIFFQIFKKKSKILKVPVISGKLLFYSVFAKNDIFSPVLSGSLSKKINHKIYGKIHR